ncbi:GILT-like protein 1 [Teleopsis dalmanni]|uniref:GILT-like protein 1 n=1 Tax=Teleopsis dalmanni TaxID=139649 RepID=UPI0018CE6E68|nr:GILT-like protein 1 [Teleopsis dalmanni]
MLNLRSILVIIAIACLGIVSEAQQKKLNVLILYESLCPDSIRFMAKQLGPSYDLLKDYIDISLIPFGKSQSQNNGAEFYCQHGPSECEGNRLQSCMLLQTSDQTTQVKFAVCQMTAEDKLTGKYCAEKVGLSNDIDACMHTELGTYLQLKAERVTHSYAPTFVPTIVYDNVFNQQLQDSSLRDFRGTICNLLQKRGIIGFHNPACQ